MSSAIMDTQALIENPALPEELRQKVLQAHVKSEEKDTLLKVCRARSASVVTVAILLCMLKVNLLFYNVALGGVGEQ